MQYEFSTFDFITFNRSLSEAGVVLIRSLIHASFYMGFAIHMENEQILDLYAARPKTPHSDIEDSEDSENMSDDDDLNIPKLKNVHSHLPEWILPITNLLNGWDYKDPEIEFKNLKQYFYDKFVKDIAELANIFALDIERAYMSFHLFLQKIMSFNSILG